MASNGEIEFQVDEQYENEKGVFTVVSIEKDEMVIQWEDGENIRTDIELQRRIQYRRQQEQANREAKARAAERGSGKSAGAAKQDFVGLQSSDFKNTAARTKWRGRDQLGGTVAQKVPKADLKINSWAFTQKPEVHWQDTAHHGREDIKYQARFFARLDTKSLAYGFCAARQAGKSGLSRDWDAFNNWLKQAKNERLLHELATDDKLALQLNTASASIELQPAKDGWTIAGGSKKQTVDALAPYIESMPVENGVELEVFRKIDKAAALERGREIADDIAGVFDRLMPLYRTVLS